MQVRLVTPCLASTVYHFPIRISKMVVIYIVPIRFGGQTFINCNPYMVRDIVFPNINNVITRIRYAVKSSNIIFFIIVEVKTSVSTSELVSITIARHVVKPYPATSAYVSIAVMLFLLFSAIGMRTFLTPNRSPTFSKANCKNFLR